MNDAIAHAPLSSEGHIGIMTDGMPSMNTCGHLKQLQVWKLLQCGVQVVCLEGLYGGLEALLFDFKELPLWNAAGLDEPTRDPSFIEVDLSITEPEATNTTPIPPPFQPLNLHMTSPQPSTYTSRGLGMAAVDFPYNLSLHLSA